MKRRNFLKSVLALTSIPLLDMDDIAESSEISISDISWSASDGNLDSVHGSRYAVLGDDNGDIAVYKSSSYADYLANLEIGECSYGPSTKGW